MTEIVVEFGVRTQSLDALREATYRLIGQASCQIEEDGSVYRCRLTPAKARASADDLKARFLDLVTDENLREKVASETRRTRDVILALAFGSLAAQSD